MKLKMLTKKSLFTVLAILTLTACAQQKNENSNGVDENGNCKYPFVHDYNQVIDATTELEATYDQINPKDSDILAARNKLKHQCSIMTAYYKGTTCFAKTEGNDTRKSFAYEDLRPNCESLQRQIKDLKGQPVSTKPNMEKLIKSRIELFSEEAY